MSEIKPGDSVQLKSGSPIMTVEHIGDFSERGGPQQGAACVWFDGNKPIHKTFALHTLVKYRDD